MDLEITNVHKVSSFYTLPSLGIVSLIYVLQFYQFTAVSHFYSPASLHVSGIFCSSGEVGNPTLLQSRGLMHSCPTRAKLNVQAKCSWEVHPELQVC
jgi:hypothetical protein